MKRPTLFTLFLVVFMDLVGFGIIMPLLPYFASRFGATGVEIGFLFASYSLMQFIFAPMWGRLSDRIGRRPVILLSLFGSTVSYLFFAMSTTFWMLLASRLFAGVCGANIAVANAYIADVTTPANRSKGMGVVGAAFGLGFIFGPVLAAVFGKFGHTFPAFAAAAICGVNLVLAWFYLPESREGTRGRSSAGGFLAWGRDLQRLAGRPVLTALGVIGFLANLAVALWETTFALFLKDRPGFQYTIEEFGYLLAFVGLVVALFQGGMIGRLVKRFGEPTLLVASAVFFFVGLGALPFCHNLTALLFALFVLGCGHGLNRPIVLGLVSQSAGAGEQGLVLGIFQGLSSLARIIGPLAGGWLLDRGTGFPFWAGAALMAWAIVLSVVVKTAFRTT